MIGTSSFQLSFDLVTTAAYENTIRVFFLSQQSESQDTKRGMIDLLHFYDIVVHC